MVRIATLTLNPAIDASSQADAVTHTHKVRTTGARFAPGGGGINVARVLDRLGADVEALYLAGGLTGPLLGGLLDQSGIAHRPIAIAGDTRISMTIFERRTGLEYRFVPAGPALTNAECQRCLDQVGALECSWLVLSGSLPAGVADDFYARIVAAVRARGIAVVLDSSGPVLKATLAAGGVRLVKPSLGELEQIAGHTLDDADAILAAARAVVATGGARTVAVTMGSRGALLVEAERTLMLSALDVPVCSAVGAGDSFVAAMTHGLVLGWDVEQAFRLGMAAGTAAVLTPGTELCRLADVERLARMLGVTEPIACERSG